MLIDNMVIVKVNIDFDINSGLGGKLPYLTGSQYLQNFDRIEHSNQLTNLFAK